MRQPREEEIQAGEGWGILLVVLLVIIASVSIVVDIADKVPQ